MVRRRLAASVLGALALPAAARAAEHNPRTKRERQAERRSPQPPPPRRSLRKGRSLQGGDGTIGGPAPVPAPVPPAAVAAFAQNDAPPTYWPTYAPTVSPAGNAIVISDITARPTEPPTASPSRRPSARPSDRPSDVGSSAPSAPPSESIPSPGAVRYFDSGIEGNAPWNVTLVGAAAYDYLDHPAARAITVALLQDDPALAYTVEFDDTHVTVTKMEGWNRTVLAALVEGEAATFADWRGTGMELVVMATKIDIGANPPEASVEIAFGPGGGVDPPSDVPSEAATASPSAAPSEASSGPPSLTPSLGSTKRPSASPTHYLGAPCGPILRCPDYATCVFVPVPFPLWDCLLKEGALADLAPTFEEGADPTDPPSNVPTTTAPTESPSLPPTMKQPSGSPTASTATKQPSASPSASPTTKSPSKGPGASPTVSIEESAPYDNASSMSMDLTVPEVTATTSDPTESPTSGPTQAPIGACGDGMCAFDVGETSGTCPADCASQTYGTKSKGNTKASGQAFTLEATRGEVKIDELEVVGAKDGESQCAVYTRRGTHRGHVESSGGWQKVLDKTVTLRKGVSVSLGGLSAKPTIPEGGKRAFYVYCEKGLMVAETSSWKAKERTSDGALIVHGGVATKKLFEKAEGRAKFSGGLRYDRSKQ